MTVVVVVVVIIRGSSSVVDRILPRGQLFHHGLLFGANRVHARAQSPPDVAQLVGCFLQFLNQLLLLSLVGVLPLLLQLVVRTNTRCSGNGNRSFRRRQRRHQKCLWVVMLLFRSHHEGSSTDGAHGGMAVPHPSFRYCFLTVGTPVGRCPWNRHMCARSTHARSLPFSHTHQCNIQPRPPSTTRTRKLSLEGEFSQSVATG